MLAITESVAGINGFSDILKDKYNNNLTIQALVQVWSCKSKAPIEYIRVGKISVGKTLANGCQFAKFANIFPRHIIALYGIVQYNIHPKLDCTGHPLLEGYYWA